MQLTEEILVEVDRRANAQRSEILVQVGLLPPQPHATLVKPVVAAWEALERWGGPDGDDLPIIAPQLTLDEVLDTVADLDGSTSWSVDMCHNFLTFMRVALADRPEEDRTRVYSHLLCAIAALEGPHSTLNWQRMTHCLPSALRRMHDPPLVRKMPAHWDHY